MKDYFFKINIVSFLYAIVLGLVVHFESSFGLINHFGFIIIILILINISITLKYFKDKSSLIILVPLFYLMYIILVLFLYQFILPFTPMYIEGIAIIIYSFLGLFFSGLVGVTIEKIKNNRSTESEITDEKEVSTKNKKPLKDDILFVSIISALVFGFGFLVLAGLKMIPTFLVVVVILIIVGILIWGLLLIFKFKKKSGIGLIIGMLLPTLVIGNTILEKSQVNLVVNIEQGYFEEVVFNGFNSTEFDELYVIMPIEGDDKSDYQYDSVTKQTMDKVVINEVMNMFTSFKLEEVDNTRPGEELDKLYDGTGYVLEFINYNTDEYLTINFIDDKAIYVIKVVNNIIDRRKVDPNVDERESGYEIYYKITNGKIDIENFKQLFIKLKSIE